MSPADDSASPETWDTEPLLATLAQIAAAQGDAMAVAVLAEATGTVTLSEQYTDFGREYFFYTLRLTLPVDLYGRLGTERDSLAARLKDVVCEVTTAATEYHVVRTVVMAPDIAAPDGWRTAAKAWLRGEGITNQGRVRSDNIAARQQDGLLFRSQPEIHLYQALKTRGVYFAPLPVFLRGGETYQRLEPDFVLLYKGVVMVVEVDGATVHRESPAEAHARTQGLLREGVRVERVNATECADLEAAHQCAEKLLDALARYSELRI